MGRWSSAGRQNVVLSVDWGYDMYPVVLLYHARSVATAAERAHLSHDRLFEHVFSIRSCTIDTLV